MNHKDPEELFEIACKMSDKFIDDCKAQNLNPSECSMIAADMLGIMIGAFVKKANFSDAVAALQQMAALSAQRVFDARDKRDESGVH